MAWRACTRPTAKSSPQHSDVIMGRDGIRAFWREVLSLGLKAATLQTVEVQASGHLAVEVGKFTLLAAGGQLADAGKYIVIWRNDMGRWLLHRDIWNNSGPAPARKAEENSRAPFG